MELLFAEIGTCNMYSGTIVNKSIFILFRYCILIQTMLLFLWVVGRYIVPIYNSGL